MSNEKLNTQYLITEIATKSGETKKDIDLFLKEFMALIQDILLKEKIVKIKGLGTFKLSWNESRKSVNVQTGQEIEIAGHNKIVFTPENELKDLINEPYSHLETVMLDENDETSQKEESKIDPIKNFSIQAQEIVSLISEIKSSAEENIQPLANKEVLQQPEIEPENIIIENKIEVSSDIVNNNFTPQKEMKEEELPKTHHTHDTLGNHVSSNHHHAKGNGNHEANEAVDENKKEKKKSSGGKWFFIILFLLAAGFAVCWFFIPDCELIKFVKTELNLNNQPIVVPADSTKVKTDEIGTPIDTMSINQNDNYNEDNAETLSVDFNVNDYEMQIAIARKGTRLAWFSTVYYGSYMFWPYIYLANKEQIANPHQIELGQRIKIPKLPSEMIDVNNPEAIGRVKYIEEHLDQY